jgi:hypothetical protein
MDDTTDETGPSAQGVVQLDLNGFEGPLDLLLELARRQAVDIAKISAIDLADQFLAATEGPGQGQPASGRRLAGHGGLAGLAQIALAAAAGH